MLKYSIVTPLYNSFNLMDRYFKSFEDQTYKNFEIIIVDDCSTDDSYSKVKEYAEKSQLKISVYQTEKNAGPGNARNIGMNAAKGEWITFVDNDDWVDLKLLEKIEIVSKEYEVNCIIYDYYLQKESKKIVSHSMYFGETGPVSISDCMIYARNHAVCKFYRLANCRESNVRYPALKRCEDVAFSCRAIEACGKAYYLKEPLYYYFQRSSSLSNNKDLDESEMIKAFYILEKTIGKKYPEELKEKSVVDLLYSVVLMMCKAGKSNRKIREYISYYNRKYEGWENSKIINHIGKSKKIFVQLVKLRFIIGLKAISWMHTKMVR